MGNWRAVALSGSCPADQVEVLKAHLVHANTALDELFAREDREKISLDEWDKVPEPHALCYSPKPSLFGLWNWPAEVIQASGNVGKDTSIQELVESLLACSAVAPGLQLTVHVGEEWERDGCVCTLDLEDGKVDEGPPQVPTVEVTVDVGRRMAIALTWEDPR